MQQTRLGFTDENASSEDGQAYVGWKFVAVDSDLGAVNDQKEGAVSFRRKNRPSIVSRQRRYVGF